MRVLFSKPDSLGDQFIAAGIVQAFQELRPDCQVVWHVRSGMEVFAPLVGAAVFTPAIDQPPESEAARLEAQTALLIVLPFPLSPYEPWTDTTRRHVLWWTAFLRATSWDVSILGLVNRTWVGDLTVAIAPATTRFGFAANAARQPLVNEAQAACGADAPTFSQTLNPSFTRTEAEQLRDLFSVLEPRLSETKTPPVWRPREQWQPGSSGTRRVLIAPGVGGDPRRAWGIKNFLRLAEAFRARGATVTWIEGPHDAAYLEGLPAPEETSRVRFKPHELEPLAAFLRQHDVLVCHDTAYVHLAAGIGIPTLAIYGAGQHGRFHPVGGRIKIVQSEIACSGCQWHCLWDRLVCVNDIPVERVILAAEQLLANNLVSVAVTLATPVALAPEGELAAVKRRLQEEVLALNADRFARLHIIQNLLTPRPAPPPVTPPAAEPRLSVIVPMGRPERVAPTLASFARQSKIPAHWEIVLVGVEAENVARAHPHLPIVPVRLAANVLPPRTRCLGVERATGEWLLFIDDDVELEPEVYERFTALLATSAFAAEAAHPIGAVGFRLPGKSGRFFERLTDISNFWAQQHATAEDRDWLYSAAILVRAEAYRRAGGFNPELPNGEDVDLTRRIAAAGYRLRYEPTLVARHDHRRDTLFSMWRYFWRNGNAARYFFAAHGGACPFSVKTVWLKAWSDLRMNQEFQRARGVPLGFLTPLIWLNYLIVEASLDWHWQEYLHEERRYRRMPARARSDATYVSALTEWDEGRNLRGALRYLLAVLQDFRNPVRR